MMLAVFRRQSVFSSDLPNISGVCRCCLCFPETRGREMGKLNSNLPLEKWECDIPVNKQESTLTFRRRGEQPDHIFYSKPYNLHFEGEANNLTTYSIVNHTIHPISSENQGCSFPMLCFFVCVYVVLWENMRLRYLASIWSWNTGIVSKQKTAERNWLCWLVVDW